MFESIANLTSRRTKTKSKNWYVVQLLWPACTYTAAGGEEHHGVGQQRVPRNTPLASRPPLVYHSHVIASSRVALQSHCSLFHSLSSCIMIQLPLACRLALLSTTRLHSLVQTFSTLLAPPLGEQLQSDPPSLLCIISLLLSAPPCLLLSFLEHEHAFTRFLHSHLLESTWKVGYTVYSYTITQHISADVVCSQSHQIWSFLNSYRQIV